MFRKLFAFGCGVAALAFAGSASAVTWTSALEYRDTGASTPTQSSTPYGTVTIEDGFDGTGAHPDGTTVKVTVTLTNPDSLFVNTGGPHDPFLYNLEDPADVTVVNAVGQDFFDGGRTTPAAFEATPFGKFTNKIGCCRTWVPDQNVISGFHIVTTYSTTVLPNGKTKQVKTNTKVNDYTFVPAHWEESNGSANGIKGPLVFFLHDDAGITFAGVGAKFDLTTGKLLTQGTGNHFFSNDAPSGKWWFTADICDANVKGGNPCTYNVGAKDAFRIVTTAVPEPATWALMILGFGGAGAMLRRRRAIPA